MRYFLDTEFIERPGLLDLISIGLVAADGREFYAVSSEFKAAKASDWVRANVFPHLLPRAERKKRAAIRADLLAFIGADKPEFWAYFADYDWVLFCWLFGAMVDLPKGWPMLCLDLKQSMIERGIEKGALPVQRGTEHNALEDARWVREAHGVVMAARAVRA